MVDNPRLYDFVPFDYALRCWRNLAPDARYDTVERKRYIPARFRKVLFPPDEEPIEPPAPRVYPAGRCQRCGGSREQPGFVRFCFPVGHELFGKPICCPECWPAPFGSAGGLPQSDVLESIGKAWERKMRERVEEREPEREEVPW